MEKVGKAITNEKTLSTSPKKSVTTSKREMNNNTGENCQKIWHCEIGDFILPTFQRTPTCMLKLSSIEYCRDSLVTKYKFANTKLP